MSISAQYQTAFLVLLALVFIAPLSFDIGPVPITLQTLIIFIGASLLPWRISAVVLLFYLAIGALGAPVFGDHSSGYEKLYGPTAGFLWGFVICAMYVSVEAARKEFHFFRAILVFVQAHILLLLPGFLVLVWLLPEVKVWETLVKLFPGLIIKSILGGIIASQIRKAIVPQS